MKNIIVDDAMLDRWACEYYNEESPTRRMPYYHICTFAEFVEMKKKLVAIPK